MQLAKLALGFEKMARKRFSPLLTPWILALPSYMAGIFCADYLGARRPLATDIIQEMGYFAWLIVGVVACLACMLLCRRLLSRGAIYWLCAWCILWHCVGLYMACERTRLVPQNGEEISAVIEVRGIVQASPGGRYVDVDLIAWRSKTTSALDSRRTRLWLQADEDPVWGRYYWTRLKFNALQGPEIEGSYSARQTMRSKGYAFSVSRRGPIHALEERMSLHQSLMHGLSKAREKAYQSLMQSSPHGVQAALALGIGSTVDEDTRESFARLGLAHILSVSGFHFSILAAAVLWLISVILGRWHWAVRRFSKQRLSALVALPLLFLYLLYVGAPLPAQRAFVMSMSCTCARLIGSKSETMRSMTLAAFIILLDEPRALFSLSFCLSFVAVFGLFWTLQHYNKPVQILCESRFGAGRWAYKISYFFASMILISLGTTLASAPLLVYHFQQLPLSGILTNLWVLPIVSFIMLPLAFLASLLAPIASELSSYAGKLCALFEQAVVYTVDVADAYLPISYIRIEAWWPTMLWLVVLAGLCFVPCLRAKQRFYFSGVALVCVILCGILSLFVQERFSHTLRITSVSMGQADATLMQLPNGQNILIDAGSPAGMAQNAGKARLLPYFARLRLRRIDTIYITHPDYDHYAGLSALIGRISIGEIVTNGQQSVDPAYTELLEDAMRAGIVVRSIRNLPRERRLGAVTIERLWPPESALDEEEFNTNEQSIVLHVKYGDFRMLLMGDAGLVVEERLIAQKMIRGPVQFLKAGHHGSQSATGEAFLQSIRPNYVIFSMGKDNRYRFPHTKTVQRALQSGARLFRHDWHGSVRFTTDGYKVLIESMR